MTLATYLLKRVLLLIPTFFGVSIIVFLLIHLLPGDPATVMLADVPASQNDVLLLRERLGLGKPWPDQYLTFMGNLLKGNLGQSIHYGQPTASLIAAALPATIELTIAAMIILVLISIPLGVFAATRKGTLSDHLAVIASVIGFSSPNFWLGIMGILIFSADLRWLPSFGRISPTMHVPRVTGFLVLDSILTGNLPALSNSLTHIIMPAFVLAISGAAITARLTRASMIDVLRQDFIKVLFAKGSDERSVVYKHALRNSLIPVITFLSLQFGYLLGGVVIVESVFSWPGMGTLLITAIQTRDYQVVQAVVLTFALMWMAVNIVTDVAYSAIDPRIRYG